MCASLAHQFPCSILFLISVPWVFKVFWNAIQSFIDPNTKSKCKFDEAIKGEVPPQQLTTDFGGLLNFQYDEKVHESYWKQLVTLCSERREGMERRFKEECGEEIGASEWVILGGDEKEGQVDQEKNEDEKEVKEEKPEQTQENGFSDLKKTTTTGSLLAVNSSAFQTPSETLNENPLERSFSSTSGNEKSATTPAANGAESSALDPTHERPAEEDEQDVGKKGVNGAGNEKRNSGSEGGFSKFMHKSIKKTGDKFHKFEDMVHQHQESRRNSQDLKKSKSKSSTSERSISPTTSATPGAVNGASTAGTSTAAPTIVGISHSNETGKEKAEMKESGTTATFVKVLFFASAKEAAGTSSLNINIPISSTIESESALKASTLPFRDLPGSILSQLKINSPSNSDLEGLKSILSSESGVKWSLNEEMIDEDQFASLELKGGEEIAIIPPVSGG